MRRPRSRRWSSDARTRTLIPLANDCVGNETWVALTTRWSETELVELLVLAGSYHLVSDFLNSAGV